VSVYGVDRSLEMLRQARHNCPSAGVCFLQQDIRCLASPSQAKVNVAEALQSFGNLEKPAPAAARKATAPGNPLHDQE
jgi:ubiquinone/menaquinone biosynthesis C-methylase UbiE